jgi:hypothetical protein
MPNNDPSELVDLSEQHIERAIASTDQANPQTDIESVGDLYSLTTGFDDVVYTLELELHTFELVQLVMPLFDGLEHAQHADELAFKSRMIGEFADACPEFFEDLDDLAEQMDDPRGYQ